MLANSYLILGPNEPGNIASAALTQRHSIPLIWALFFAGEDAEFKSEKGDHFLATTVGEALKVLDRGRAAWNYNSYFRDTLAPVTTFREWLADHLPETPLYVNVTELIGRSPTPSIDLKSLSKLGDEVDEALEAIEEKKFTEFINDLRHLAHPFITVPITGDRDRDIHMLTYEVRDTGSVEAEMALQLVGVDRDKSLLKRSTDAIQLLKDGSKTDSTRTGVDLADDVPTLLAPDTMRLQELVQRLKFPVISEKPGQLLLDVNGVTIRILKISKPILSDVVKEHAK